MSDKPLPSPIQPTPAAEQRPPSGSYVPPGRSARYLPCLAEIAQDIGSGRPPAELFQNSLRLLAEAAGADRAYIFERDPRQIDGIERITQLFEWCAEGIHPEIGNPTLRHLDMEAEGYPGWTGKMLANEVVKGHIVDFGSPVRDNLEVQGIQSILLIPIYLENAWVELIGFDACRRRRAWGEEEIELLRTAGTLLAGARRHLLQLEALREASALLTSIVARAPVPVFVYDRAGAIICASESFYRLTGHTPDLVHDLRDWTRLTQPEGERRDAMLRRLMGKFDARSSGVEGAFAIQCRDDSMRYWTLHTTCVPGGASGDTVVLAMAVDQTAEREARQSLAQAQKFHAVSPLATSLVQQVGNALIGMMGYASLARDHLRSGHPTEGLIDRIETAAHEASEAIAELALFTDTTARRHAPIGLGRVVEEVLSVHADKLADGIKLHKVISSDLWQVAADPRELGHAVLNVFLNAVEAMPDGGRLSITAANLDIDSEFVHFYDGLLPGPHVYLSIEDGGLGMELGDVRRAVEAFYTTKSMGRGLGLTVADGIIQGLGGRMTIYSERGFGTTVKVYLPAIPASANEEPRRRKPLAPSAQGQHLLLVDDEDVILSVGGEIFQYLGFNVHKARDAEEALRLASSREVPIDFVVLDLGLPDMPGDELFPLLTARRPRAKVIICSGFGEDERVRKMRREGALGFIQKPFRADELGERLREMLGE